MPRDLFATNSKRRDMNVTSQKTPTPCGDHFLDEILSLADSLPANRNERVFPIPEETGERQHCEVVAGPQLV